jgi:hypothetical protein
MKRGFSAESFEGLAQFGDSTVEAVIKVHEGVRQLLVTCFAVSSAWVGCKGDDGPEGWPASCPRNGRQLTFPVPRGAKQALPI